MEKVYRPTVQGAPKCGVAPLRSGAGLAAGTHGWPRGLHCAAEAGGSAAHHLTVAKETHGCPRGSGTEAGGGGTPHLTVVGVPMEQVQADPTADGGHLLIDARAVSEDQAGHLAMHSVCLSGFECAGNL
jgi:hypothetical protein